VIHIVAGGAGCRGAGESLPRTHLDNVKVDSVLVAMNIKAEYID
jgi:hypothetical protein